MEQSKSIDLLSRALYALRSYKDLKIRAKHIRMATKTRYNQAVLQKCMNAWRKKAPELHLKNELCNELSNDYQVKLLGKVFQAFRLNAQYRHERRETDSVMANAVQEITVRKFFRGWRSLTGKRMGLLMLAETMQRLQVASFFKRAGRKALHETQALSHIALLRDYLNLSKTFDALRKRKLQRDVDVAKTGSFQQIRQLLSLKQHFKVWRKRFNLAITKERIAKYAISHV